MKKKLFTLLALIVCLSITGCNDEVSQNAQSESKQVQEQTNGTNHNSVEQKDSEDSVSESPANDETINNDVESVDKISTGFSTESTIEDAKDGYFIVSKLDGTLYGLLDSFGTEVIPVEYDYISFPDSKEAQSVIVKVEGKSGILNYEGNEILPIEYETIRNSGLNSTRYLVQKDGVQSIVELDGTTYKELVGEYTDLIGNSFLVQSSYSVFSLDETQIFASQNKEFIYELDSVTDYIGVYYDAHSVCLMDLNGEIALSFDYSTIGVDQSDLVTTVAEDQGNTNLVSEKYAIVSSGTSYERVINIQQKSISDTNYIDVAGNAEFLFALYTDATTDTNLVDVYDSNGKILQTLEIDAELIELSSGNPFIVAKNGETYRVYNKEGKEITGDRYLEVEPLSDCLMLQNLDGEYGIMGSSGEMLIEFGAMGEESYNGYEWKDTYSFDDTFCIVTESSSDSNVWLFPSAS